METLVCSQFYIHANIFISQMSCPMFSERFVHIHVICRHNYSNLVRGIYSLFQKLVLRGFFLKIKQNVHVSLDDIINIEMECFIYELMYINI